ncbi:MAG TPA: ubiquinol-cytochrome C chaperone family protein [Acetobacteraceae bacterium]
MIERDARPKRGVARLTSLLAVRRDRYERAGFLLYAAAVRAARAPFLYAELGVPDTLDGRFDLIGLYAFLLIERLRLAPAPGPALAQAVFDAMFSDMDVALREMGVGDLSVGKKVRVMWNAFHGRARAYAAPTEARDVEALEAAITRNVWRGRPPPPGAGGRLARLALAEHDQLAGQLLSGLAEGFVSFLDPGSTI